MACLVHTIFMLNALTSGSGWMWNVIVAVAQCFQILILVPRPISVQILSDLLPVLWQQLAMWETNLYPAEHALHSHNHINMTWDTLKTNCLKFNKKRNAYHDLAMAKLKEGNVNAASELFQRAVHITPLMAHKLIQTLKSENIEFVVAPPIFSLQGSLPRIQKQLQNLSGEQKWIHLLLRMQLIT